MPIGIVSDEDFYSELGSYLPPKESDSSLAENSDGVLRPSVGDESDSPNSDSPVPTLPTIEQIQRGRGNAPEVPEVLRAALGIDAVENGNKSTKKMTKEFGISDSSLSAYKNGSTSTASYDSPDKPLLDKVNSARLRITSRAQNRLLEALKNITPEKLESAKLRDIASTAQAMSAVIRNIEPQTNNQNNQNVNFVFFAPKLKQESDYDVITVNE